MKKLFLLSILALSFSCKQAPNVGPENDSEAALTNVESEDFVGLPTAYFAKGDTLLSLQNEFERLKSENESKGWQGPKSDSNIKRMREIVKEETRLNIEMRELYNENQRQNGK